LSIIWIFLYSRALNNGSHAGPHVVTNMSQCPDIMNTNTQQNPLWSLKRRLPTGFGLQLSGNFPFLPIDFPFRPVVFLVIFNYLSVVVIDFAWVGGKMLIRVESLSSRIGESVLSTWESLTRLALLSTYWPQMADNCRLIGQFPWSDQRLWTRLRPV